MPAKLQYSPEEFIAELGRQSLQAQALAGGLNEAALNWQPNGGKSWSVGQCLQHLVQMNTSYATALREAAENNSDQLEPRTAPMQPKGWLARLFLNITEPPPKFNMPAPSKIAPPSQVTSAVLGDFEAAQQSLAEFMKKYGSADLGDIRYKNPIGPIVNFTIDTGLLVIAAHNRRHLWQAENVRKSVGFPG